MMTPADLDLRTIEINANHVMEKHPAFCKGAMAIFRHYGTFHMIHIPSGGSLPFLHFDSIDDAAAALGEVIELWPDWEFKDGKFPKWAQQIDMVKKFAEIAQRNNCCPKWGDRDMERMKRALKNNDGEGVRNLGGYNGYARTKE